ncbi:hypothetical protein GINT2_002215 [Glugoides intestinalis]
MEKLGEGSNSSTDISIEEFVNQCITNDNSEDFLLEQQMLRNTKIADGMEIPDAGDIACSPELTFGKNTLDMIDEFIQKENSGNRNKTYSWKIVFKKLFCCF